MDNVLLYHGSTIEIKKPDLYIGRSNLDFGQGFYLTSIKKQAEKWAKRRRNQQKRTESLDTQSIISTFRFSEIGLKIVRFNGYSEKWLDFVVANRGNFGRSQRPECDVIIGNIADDDVAREIDAFIELLSKNRVNGDVRRATLFQLQFSEPNDQYCFVTQQGLSALSFDMSYIL